MKRSGRTLRRAMLASLQAGCLVVAGCGGSTRGAGEALAAKQGCLSCHGMINKQVGPGFAQVAERYRNDPAAQDQVAAHISGGSVGRWGRVIMPKQSQLSQEEARLLATWVLSLPAPSEPKTP